MTQVGKAKEGLYGKLFDEDEERVIEAIDELKEKGDADAVSPLLQLLLSPPSLRIERSLLSLFYGLKDPAAIAAFFSVIDESKYYPIQPQMLSIVWNANFDCRTNLARLVSIGLRGSFQSLFEVVTIVENIEGELEEEQLLESIENCRRFLNENPMHEKRSLTEELLELLLQRERDNSDF